MSVDNVIKNIGKDTLIYLPSRFLPALITLISYPIITKLFLPAEYGNFDLVATTVTFVSVIFSGWLAQAVLRYYDDSVKNNDEAALYSTAFFSWQAIVFLGVVLGSIIIVALKKSFSPQLYFLFLIGILNFASAMTTNVLYYLVRAKREITLWMILQIVASVGHFGILLFFALVLKMGVESLILSLIVADCVIVVITMYKLSILGHFKLNNFSREYLNKFIKYGFPIVGIGLATWVLNLSDRWIIKIFRGPAEVGIYSISNGLAYKLIIFAVQTFNLAAFPVLISAWNTYGQESTLNLLRTLVKYYLMIAVPVTVILFILSHRFMSIIVDAKYEEGYIVFPWVALGALLYGFTMITNKFWELKERTHIIFLLSIVAAILKIVLNLIFIPKYGYIAAGVTAAVCYGFYVLMAIWKSDRIIFKLDLTGVRNILISTLLIFVFLFLLVDRLPQTIMFSFLLLVSSVMLYMFSLVMLKEIRLREVKTFLIDILKKEKI